MNDRRRLHPTMSTVAAGEGLLWFFVLQLMATMATMEADRVRTDDDIKAAVRWIKSNAVTEVVARRSVKSSPAGREEESRLRWRRALFSASDASSIVDAHNSVRRLEGAADMELMVSRKHKAV